MMRFRLGIYHSYRYSVFLLMWRHLEGDNPAGVPSVDYHAITPLYY